MGDSAPLNKTATPVKWSTTGAYPGYSGDSAIAGKQAEFLKANDTTYYGGYNPSSGNLDAATERRYATLESDLSGVSVNLASSSKAIKVYVWKRTS